LVSIWFLLTETTTTITGGAYDPPKQGGYTNKQTNKLMNYRTSGKTWTEKINPSVTIACQWGQLELKLPHIIDHSIMSRYGI
jgi:hypothetical protein